MTTNQQINKPPSPFANDDLLWRQLKTIPAFRAILRAVESRFYFAVDLPGPTLDVGCGDGHFAQMTFDRRIDVHVSSVRQKLGIRADGQSWIQAVRGQGYQLVQEG